MVYGCNRGNKHPLPTAILFFKIILKTTLQDGKLKIPKNFIRKYGGDMSNPMFLRPPDGTEWEVFWTKHDGDVWLQKGWKKFATYYSLDHGHMVLFEYKQTSNFEVHIFDKSTLEIQYPFHGSQDAQDNIDQIIDDDSVQILDELPRCHKTRQKSPISSPQPLKKFKTGASGDVGRSSTVQNLPQHVQIEGINLEKSKFASVNKEQDEDMGSTTEFLKVEMSTSKIIEALNKAATFRSKSPSFTVVMKLSYVNRGFLHVPLQVAEKYLKKKEGNILLQVLDGRTWYCNYSSGKINAGWKKFVSDNNLNAGDVCLFELTKIRGLSLKVLIFPLVEESHSPPVQGGKATQNTSMPICSGSFTNGVMKEASKFASENPSFTVNISQRIRPHLPAAFIREYFNNKTQIVKLQFGEKLWPVKLFCCPSKSSVWGRLYSGWTLFARENKLVDGDVCVFELINKEDAVFDVHIFRCHYSAIQLEPLVP